MKPFIRTAAAIAAALLCLGARPTQPDIDSTLGRDAAARLRHFKSVEVFLENEETDDATYDRWVTSAKEDLSDGPLAQQIVATLLNVTTFRGSAFRCFDPGLGLRVRGPSPTDPPLEIRICFHCHQMEVSLGEQTKMVPFNTKGPLKALLRRAFPKRNIDDFIGRDEG